MATHPLSEYAANRRVVPKTYSISFGDVELVDELAKLLVCSNSEVVRTAIRTLATHMGYLNRNRGDAVT